MQLIYYSAFIKLFAITFSSSVDNNSNKKFNLYLKKHKHINLAHNGVYPVAISVIVFILDTHFLQLLHKYLPSYALLRVCQTNVKTETIFEILHYLVYYFQHLRTLINQVHLATKFSRSNATRFFLVRNVGTSTVAFTLHMCDFVHLLSSANNAFKKYNIF